MKDLRINIKKNNGYITACELAELKMSPGVLIKYVDGGEGVKCYFVKTTNKQFTSVTHDGVIGGAKDSLEEAFKDFMLKNYKELFGWKLQGQIKQNEWLNNGSFKIPLK